MITGKTLIQWGFVPGPGFTAALEKANQMQDNGLGEDQIFQHLQTVLLAPQEKIGLRTNALPYGVFIEPENEIEQENVAQVHQAMDALMRTPTIKKAAIMPDACPAGVIPVGGVVATENAIHPGWHSADICCSMALTVFKRDDEPKRVLDAVHRYVHFGPQKREAFPAYPTAALLQRMTDNPFLKGLENFAQFHFTTQGDGNHFYTVGRLESTGQVAIVSHHGSRGLGAQLYKRGLAVAQRHTRKVADRIPGANAWLAADSQEGQDYWEALQLIREWTKQNHFAIHNLVQADLGNAIEDRFWNEHNFVFQRSDGLFYHAKGATPSYKGFSADDDGRTLIPMNMAEPILITGHTDKKGALGFAPHGAGRNMSRTRFLREYEAEHPEGIDVRFFCGIPDPSELPNAYKNAVSVIRQIEKFGLATIIDRVIPYGSIMAGDWERDAPWRKNRK